MLLRMNIQGERFGDTKIGIYRTNRGGPTFHVGSDSELGLGPGRLEREKSRVALALVSSPVSKDMFPNSGPC
jgi:hypothetical protein